MADEKDAETHSEGDEDQDADIFDRDPTKCEKIEMRKASKRPSEWVKLLCKDWAEQNKGLVEMADAKFLEYKPYLKGHLTSQLLCRLSVSTKLSHGSNITSESQLDFWLTLGISDEFDREYIVSQVEKFCSVFSIQGLLPEDSAMAVDPQLFGSVEDADEALSAAAATSLSSPSNFFNSLQIPSYSDPIAVSAAAAAAAELATSKRKAPHSKRILPSTGKRRSKKMKIDGPRQYRLTQEFKDARNREREALAQQKATERAAREAVRLERKLNVVEIQEARKKFVAEQKEAALKRAADLLSSNRVPVELTRGRAAAKAAQASIESPSKQNTWRNKSAVIVSTAGDLHQIVTAIAKEHNQKVSWTTIARELGIHVKVREKYARMHARAEQRGFDWAAHSSWRLRDYPETDEEKQARMPLPIPEEGVSATVPSANISEEQKPAPVSIEAQTTPLEETYGV